MKKKTKITKALALALTLGLLCSGLAGCGQAQSVETVSEDLATESVQPTETVGEYGNRWTEGTKKPQQKIRRPRMARWYVWHP